ncbi:MAG: phosphopantetheine-binding protein [Clostridium sp.]|jgi:acyl carrier protein|nr:phosphopantetheine-binding protein [Clostridium sp.]
MGREDVKKAVLEELDLTLKKEGVEIEVSGIDDLLEAGMNSIFFVSLAVRLEEVFQIEFDDDCLEYSKFSVLDDLVGYVEELIRRTE